MPARFSLTSSSSPLPACRTRRGPSSIRTGPARSGGPATRTGGVVPSLPPRRDGRCAGTGVTDGCSRASARS
jgi:hypothetical protein